MNFAEQTKVREVANTSGAFAAIQKDIEKPEKLESKNFMEFM